MKILIATTNNGKKKEIASLFEGYSFELVFPSDLGISVGVEETGDTYAENAVLKAETLCRLSGLPTLSDDTGLEVDALNGRPGLHSARYVSVEGATDSDRRTKIIAELQTKNKPWTARFYCAVALARPNEATLLFDGEVKGEIHSVESGDQGFGYDRLFWIPQLGKTMADLTMDEKNQISHRAVAVKKALEFLMNYSG